MLEMSEWKWDEGYIASQFWLFDDWISLNVILAKKVIIFQSKISVWSNDLLIVNIVDTQNTIEIQWNNYLHLFLLERDTFYKEDNELSQMESISPFFLAVTCCSQSITTNRSIESDCIVANKECQFHWVAYPNCFSSKHCIDWAHVSRPPH